MSADSGFQPTRSLRNTWSRRLAWRPCPAAVSTSMPPWRRRPCASVSRSVTRRCTRPIAGWHACLLLQVIEPDALFFRLELKRGDRIDRVERPTPVAPLEILYVHEHVSDVCHLQLRQRRLARE